MATHLHAATEAVARRKSAAKEGAPVEDTMTPKGTLTILLLYAGAIVLMWGYMYFSMLARR